MYIGERHGVSRNDIIGEQNPLKSSCRGEQNVTKHGTTPNKGAEIGAEIGAAQ